MKVKLVSETDILKIHKNLKYFGGKPLARLIMWILRIHKLNNIYSRVHYLPPPNFINALVDELQYEYHISDDDLKKIPSSGPFILIGNHPFGGAEAIISIHFLKEIRTDFKYMANFLLNNIQPMKPYFISVNPFETMRHLKSSYSGLKMASGHLKSGHALGIFPAGEVSTYQKEEGKITDKKWPRSIMKFIKSQEVTVVPIFYKGHNSKLFHLLGKIHPLLRTIKLPSELLNKKKQPILIKIGNPIKPSQQARYKDVESFTRFIRESTYKLEGKNY